MVQLSPLLIKIDGMNTMAMPDDLQLSLGIHIKIALYVCVHGAYIFHCNVGQPAQSHYLICSANNHKLDVQTVLLEVPSGTIRQTAHRTEYLEPYLWSLKPE
jgi:hypothetical protein